MDPPSTVDHPPQTLRESSPRSSGASPRRAQLPEQGPPAHGVKRQHPVELATEEAQAKKIRTKDIRTADERRLTGDYSIPSDAVSILRPGAHTGPPDTPPPVGTPLPNMSKKPGNTRISYFKPRNNLNSEPHAAKRQAPRSTVADKPQRRNTLDLHPVRGGNVRPATTERGDGFAEEVSTKRRKLSGESAQRPRNNSPMVLVNNSAAPMDLTGDANDESLLNARPVLQNDRKLSNSSQSSVQMLPSSKNSKKLNPFDRSSIRTNDELINGPRRRAQVRSQQHDQQATSRSHNGNMQGLIGTQNEPVEILEDDPATSRLAGNQAGMRKGGRPLQNQLERDANYRRRQGMDDDLEIAQPLHGHEGAIAHARSIATTQDPGRVSTYFEEKSIPHARSKARDRMQTNSKASTRESPFGVDELTGDTTVGHRAPKQRSASHDSHDQRDSEAEIKPTRFTHSGRNTNDAQRDWNVATQAAKSDLGSPNTIHIRAFYSSDCIADSGDLQLAFDEKEKELLLYRDDKPVMAASTNRLIHVEAANARDLSLSKGSNRVVMKGSHTATSKGCVCIALLDQESVGWLHDCVQAMTGEKYKLESVPAGKLDKLFDQQVSGILYWHQKVRMQSRIDVDDQELELMRRRQQASQAGRTQSEERVVYEDDDEPQSRRPSDVPSTQRQQQLAYRPVSTNSTLDHVARQPQAQGQRRSARAAPVQARIRTRDPTPPSPQRWTVKNQPQRWPHPVLYPSEGPRRTTIDFGDLTRLDEGEFLNDNVISFALRRTEETLSAEQQGRIHFFNTFFYSSLSTINGKRGLNYDAVKKWTKSKDLMKTPYVVVPINHDLHWFAAIICNLDKLADKNEAPEGDDIIQSADEAADGEQPDPEDIDVGMEDLELSEKGKSSINGDDQMLPETIVETAEAEEAGNANSRPSTATSKKSKKRAPPPLPKLDLNQTTIITLDSFGSAHIREVRTLKDYIVAEAVDKHGMAVDDKQIKGLTAKGLPEQDNFCDCGVFLIGYIEQFAKDPDGFVRDIFRRELHRNQEFAKFDPSKKRDELRGSLLDLQGEQEAERRGKKVAKSSTKSRSALPSLANAPQESSPNRPAGSAAAKTQMPRLPARPKERVEMPSSPSRHSPTRNPAAIPRPDAQVQGELATAVPPPIPQPDANQLGDTIPNSPEQDYSDRGESTDDREEAKHEMLDEPGYVAAQRDSQGKHTLFSSSPKKRNAVEMSSQEDRRGLPAYESGLAAFVEDSQET